MSFDLERMTGAEPDFEPVTVEEAILQVHEFSSIPTAKRELLESLITSAREWAEDFTGRSLVDQGWRQTVNLTESESSGILIRRSPFLGMYAGSPFAGVSSVSDAGVLTEFDTDAYEIRGANGKWPRLWSLSGNWAKGTYRIEYRAGYIDTVGSPSVGAVPQRFKAAILLHVEAHYNRDKDTMKMLLEVAENLLRDERAEVSIA